MIVPDRHIVIFTSVINYTDTFLMRYSYISITIASGLFQKKSVLINVCIAAEWYVVNVFCNSFYMNRTE